MFASSAAQLGLDAGLIELYRKRQPTISEHQQTIADYLRLRAFDDTAVTQLEQFLFEEACRLEQAAALTGRAREFLKEQRVLEPAEFRIARIVGEQRARAREHIFRRIAAAVPKRLGGHARGPARDQARRKTAPACRRAWECALLLKLRKELKADNLSVR